MQGRSSAAALVSVPTLVQQTSKLAGDARLVCSAGLAVCSALLSMSSWLLAAHQRRQLLCHCRPPKSRNKRVPRRSAVGLWLNLANMHHLWWCRTFAECATRRRRATRVALARTRLPVVLSALTVALTVLLVALLTVQLCWWIPGLLALHPLSAILSLLLPIVLLIAATLLLPLPSIVVVAGGLVVRLHAVHT
jgi:hypothetical protein